MNNDILIPNLPFHKGDKVKIKSITDWWKDCPLKVGNEYRITNVREGMICDIMVYEIFANGCYWGFDENQIELVK